MCNLVSWYNELDGTSKTQSPEVPYKATRHQELKYLCFISV
jgi:hypothetical protein